MGIIAFCIVLFMLYLLLVPAPEVDDPKKRMHEYDEILAINPNDSIAWYQKGVCLYDMGYREEAIHCYDKALAVNPQYADAWYNKALCDGQLGRKDASVHSWRQYLKLASSDPSQRDWIPVAEKQLRELER
jgi:tetratricopeptide (TPR) repeat protein